jgi:AcrR family transcriptional regulator
MVENKEAQKRPRGRPQVRCDDETRSVLIAAASSQFQSNGFALSNINAIAQQAGVSTKTLYRLFPAKADLFASVVSDRIARFSVDLNRALLVRGSLEDEMEHILEVYANLAFDKEALGINKLVMAEADRFPEIALSFYERAVASTNKAIEKWLQTQVERGALELDNCAQAAGMLRGMMTMEPQRATILGQAPPLDTQQIKERARICASIFIKGCGPKGTSNTLD